MSGNYVDHTDKQMTLHTPEPDWIPDGVTNEHYLVKDPSGKSIGSIEIGTDGFIQGTMIINEKLVKIIKGPKQDYIQLGMRKL